MTIPQELSALFPLLFLLLFAGFWRLVVRSLRRMARMHRELPGDPGPPLRASRWGSGMVNGVSFQNCLKVSEHAAGWQLRTMRLFGGGRLWLPHAAVRVGELVPRRWLVPAHRTLVAGEEHVRLFGPLAEFVATTYGQGPSPKPLVSTGLDRPPG